MKVEQNCNILTGSVLTLWNLEPHQFPCTAFRHLSHVFKLFAPCVNWCDIFKKHGEKGNEQFGKRCPTNCKKLMDSRNYFKKNGWKKLGKMYCCYHIFKIMVQNYHIFKSPFPGHFLVCLFFSFTMFFVFNFLYTMIFCKFLSPFSFCCSWLSYYVFGKKNQAK